jgi:hypothetical protein
MKHLGHGIAAVMIGLLIAFLLPLRGPVAARPEAPETAAQSPKRKTARPFAEPADVLFAARAGRTEPGLKHFKEHWRVQNRDWELARLLGALIVADRSIFVSVPKSTPYLRPAAPG